MYKVLLGIVGTDRIVVFEVMDWTHSWGSYYNISHYGHYYLLHHRVEEEKLASTTKYMKRKAEGKRRKKRCKGKESGTK